MNSRRLAGLGAGLLALLGVAAPGWAQGMPAAAPPAAVAERSAAGGRAEAPKVKVERTAGGRKVFRIETGFVIEGRIQKPNAFYVLQRSQINYDWSQLSQDFAPRILESVKHNPF